MFRFAGYDNPAQRTMIDKIMLDILKWIVYNLNIKRLCTIKNETIYTHSFLMTKRKEGKRWAFMIILWSGRTGQCSRCPLMRESGESGGDGNNAPQNR